MKKLLSLALASLMVVSLAGCGAKDEPAPEAETTKAAETTAAGEVETEAVTEAVTEALEDSGSSEPLTITVGIPKAPPALPVLHMIEDNLLGDDITITPDIWSGPEQLIAMVQDKSHDMFAFPLTVVAKLYNSGMDVRLMNVNTWGVTYFMTNDPDFQSWEDLKNKTVYVPLKSSPPDALTQYFLDEAGLKPGEDVEIIYASMPEVSALLASGEAMYATLIEPQCTVAMSKSDKVIRAMSFEDEWQRTTGTETMIPNAGFGAHGKFIEEHPEEAAKFQEAYKESVAWVNEHPEEAGKLAEKYLEMPAPMIKKAIPNMGMCFKTPAEAKEELDMFYNLLNDFDASMIGGKLPDEGMFYEN